MLIGEVDFVAVEERHGIGFLRCESHHVERVFFLDPDRRKAPFAGFLAIHVNRIAPKRPREGCAITLDLPSSFRLTAGSAFDRNPFFAKFKMARAKEHMVKLSPDRQRPKRAHYATALDVQ